MSEVIKIDKQNMQIDRSTPLGQAFDEMLGVADKESNPALSNLINQTLAYTEAAVVIDETISDADTKEQMLSQLRNKMSAM